MSNTPYSGCEAESRNISDCALQPETIAFEAANTETSNSETTTPVTTRQQVDAFKQAYSNAIAYLARREYSRKELKQRLLQKEYSYSLVEAVLEKLTQNGYQSDERFTEMFIRSKVSGGDGPFKIKMALREKGICESLALVVLDAQNIDWREQAKKLKEKRFGLGCESHAELAKQIRYLKNKGYYQDDIQAVVGFDS